MFQAVVGRRILFLRIPVPADVCRRRSSEAFVIWRRGERDISPLSGCFVAKRLTAGRNRGWRVAMAILLAIGCCAVWLPVPQVSSPEKDHSEPYPCMDHPCGCASAEQCWRKCCCFTNQQKVAWAERSGVKVPDYVVTAAAREKAQVTAAAARPKCAQCVAASRACGAARKVSSHRHTVAAEAPGAASEAEGICVVDDHSPANGDGEQTAPVEESHGNPCQGR